MVYNTRSTVHGQRLTVSGSRPNTKLCQEQNSVPGTKFNSGTAESQWWRGLQRSCASCATCATFFEFLLKNISKHIITSERTFDLKTWHSWHRYVELLYILTISCGTPGTNLAQELSKWHRSAKPLYTHTADRVPRSVNHKSQHLPHDSRFSLIGLLDAVFLAKFISYLSRGRSRITRHSRGFCTVTSLCVMSREA
ncbi:MAG: hypothetical protein ACI8VR_001218 [Candidatus Azotimanducaceae bacterium]|jgi:hypothetical protein